METDNITVSELYHFSQKAGLLDEKLEDVLQLIRLGFVGTARGVCGFCSIRKTDECPWKNSNSLSSPICLSYKPLKQD